MYNQSLAIDTSLNCLCNAFWMNHLNSCVHYMSVRINSTCFPPVLESPGESPGI